MQWHIVAETGSSVWHRRVKAVKETPSTDPN